MVRIMATMLKFIDRCKQKAQAKCNNLTANEISSAEQWLLLLVQKKYFKEELTTYHPGSKPKTNKGRRNFGNLWKLDPYVDTDGLCELAVNCQNPLSVLPSPIQLFCQKIVSSLDGSQNIIMHRSNMLEEHHL